MGWTKRSQNISCLTRLVVGGKLVVGWWVNGDIGWIPVYIRQKLAVVKLWNRLISLTDHRFIKRIFLWDHATALRKKKSWCADLFVLFGKLGLRGAWDDKTCVNIDTVRHQLLAEYKLKWFENVNLMPKLRTYKILKSDFGVEDYMLGNLARKQRSDIARLRMGVFPIEIECGHYRSVPAEKRL